MLLKTVFENRADLTMFDAQRRSTPDAPVARARARHGLQRICRRLGVTTIIPDRYRLARHRYIEYVRASSAREARLLEQTMPTVGQVLVAYDRNWDAALEDAGLEPRPAAKPPAATRTTWRWTEFEVMESIDGYREWLGDQHSSDQQWRNYAFEYRAPSLKALKRRGGVQNLLREAAHPDRARRTSERERNRLEKLQLERDRWWETVKSAKQRRVPISGPSSRGRELLQALQESSPQSAQQLAARFEITSAAVVLVMNDLRARGLVERTETVPTSKRQTYRAVYPKL
jgi:DNA-binding MarR family transcriptional regulator